jgi:ABC-2 type transport system permease protein
VNGLVRTGAIVRKEFRHLLRDPRILLAVLVTPVIQLLLFAYAVSFDVRDLATVVIDQDQTQSSRTYLQAYSSSGFFTVVGSAGSVAEVDGIFERGDARVAVVVPAGFADKLAAGDKAQVAVYIDGGETNAARIGQAYVTALNQVYGQKVTASWAERQGLDLTQAGRLDVRVRTWYNPDRISSVFLIPGLMVVIIMIVTVQQTAVTLVRERSLGTQEQMTISPLRTIELMLGKLLPWTALAFLDVALISVLGITVFGVPLRGSVAVLALGSALFVFASLGLGLIVSVLSPSAESANILAALVAFLPAFLLSGFAFPLESIPVVLQWLSCAFPARYMVEISRAVFLKGAGLADVAVPLAALAAYAAILLAMATLLYRKRAR